MGWGGFRLSQFARAAVAGSCTGQWTCRRQCNSLTGNRPSASLLQRRFFAGLPAPRTSAGCEPNLQSKLLHTAAVCSGTEPPRPQLRFDGRKGAMKQPLLHSAARASAFSCSLRFHQLPFHPESMRFRHGSDGVQSNSTHGRVLPARSLALPALKRNT